MHGGIRENRNRSFLCAVLLATAAGAQQKYERPPQEIRERSVVGIEDPLREAPAVLEVEIRYHAMAVENLKAGIFAAARIGFAEELHDLFFGGLRGQARAARSAR